MEYHPVAPHRVQRARALLGWSEAAFCTRLGVGPDELRSFETDGAPRWLGLALIGVLIAETDLEVEAAREAVFETAHPSRRAPPLWW